MDVGLRILLVDENEEDYTKTRDLLAAGNLSGHELTWEAEYDSASEAMRHNRHDVFLVDYHFGRRNGLELLREARAGGCAGPIIFLTGAGDHDVDLEAMQAGAADYLDKDQINAVLLERSIRYAIERVRCLQAVRESEARFRMMADAAPVLLWMSGPDGCHTFFNRPWLNFTGRTMEQELGEGWTNSVHPDDRQNCRDVFRDAFDARRNSTNEYRLRHHDGHYRWVLETATPRFTENGAFAGFIGSCIDVTGQKDARDQLATTLELVTKNQEDMLAILNELRLGIVMTDVEGRVTFLSQTCQRLLNCPADTGNTHWEVLCPFEERYKTRLKAVFARPPAEREKVPVHMETPDGRQYWMEIEVQDDPREPQRKIFFLYDMTEIHSLRQMLDEKTHFQNLVGKSEPMQTVYQQILDLSKVDSTVLIEGETGTGKELVARAIHSASHRAGQPFVAVNCAGLTDSLLGSQLFGHKRGSFTGAVEDHAGVFETAGGGTVFLDEIGDITPSVQTNLLRVLQEREITRLGDSQPRKIDVRIIAATHRDLNRLVEEGRFRLDLLYRIRVARIHLPPLRERRVDIPLLVASFLQELRATTGKPVESVGEDALRPLLDHSWPGNVRELHSAIECAVIRCRGSAIQPDDLPPELLPDLQVAETAPDPRGDERERIRTALRSTRGNRVAAARLLGVSRSTLYRRLAEYQIGTD